MLTSLLTASSCHMTKRKYKTKGKESKTRRKEGISIVRVLGNSTFFIINFGGGEKKGNGVDNYLLLS